MVATDLDPAWRLGSIRRTSSGTQPPARPFTSMIRGPFEVGLNAVRRNQRCGGVHAAGPQALSLGALVGGQSHGLRVVERQSEVAGERARVAQRGLAEGHEARRACSNEPTTTTKGRSGSAALMISWGKPHAGHRRRQWTRFASPPCSETDVATALPNETRVPSSAFSGAPTESCPGPSQTASSTAFSECRQVPLRCQLCGRINNGDTWSSLPIGRAGGRSRDQSARIEATPLVRRATEKSAWQMPHSQKILIEMQP